MLTIDFANDSFPGESKSLQHPAICYGNFQVKADSIYFTEDCAFTADCDWSLILIGAYQIRQMTETTLNFCRSLNLEILEFPVDQYSLTRTGAAPFH